MMVASSRANSPAIVCCGRLGDVCAALPLAHHLYYETGAPVPFIVSREYAPLLEAASYVEPVIVDHRFDRLGRVLRQFKSRYGKLHVAQMYSTDEQMPEAVTDSFVTDAWNRAGMLDKFGLPLVFDRRNRERESSFLTDKGLLCGEPYIVLHADGVSSPYPHRHDLLRALAGLPARIIDITEMHCEKPQDLLAALEGASCAILADSFPLHLSFACPNLPVIALQTDTPTNWFGAPPRPNWVANWRYADSANHLADIRNMVDAVLSRPAFKPFEFPKGAYNAAILDWKGRRFYTWRFHYKGNWETRLMGCDEAQGDHKAIFLPPEYDGYSQEDARLFLHKGKPHISLTISKCEGPTPTMKNARCAVIYGELQFGEFAWKVTNVKQVKYGRNDLTSMEKNWVFWSQDGKLYCLYASHPEQVVLLINGDKVVAEHRTPTLPCAFGDMRGDAIVQKNDTIVRLFHTLHRYESRKFRYFLGVARMESKPPFATTWISPVPLMAGDERIPKSTHHAKQNVVFSCGAIKSGNDFIIPISRDDSVTTLHRFSERQLGL